LPQQSLSTRPIASVLKRRRHAVLGSACALGLILAPFAGSAVVVTVTATGDSPAATTPDPSTGAQTAVVASPQPVSGGRRARMGR
jgi:hypothetical protein